MGVETKIEWCHHTWSPWHGCQRVSEGCRNCYAERQSKRNPSILGVWGPNGTRVISKSWDKPLAMDRAAARAGERRRNFPSVCDWLEDRPELDEPRARFIKLIFETSNLDHLLLTKRPENFKPLMRRILDAGLLRVSPTKRGVAHWNAVDWLHGRPPRNVWLGVSVEDQETAEARIPELLDTPAALRWVSYEPALGPVDFRGGPVRGCRDCCGSGVSDDPINGRNDCGCIGEDFLGEGELDWVVVGGESGPNARPFDIQWARDTISQCRDAGVPVFVKQLGRRPDPPDWWDESAAPHVRRVIREAKGGDPLEWPEDLRVREMPEGGGA